MGSYSAAEHKCLKRGVKEVVKSIRRGNKGSVVSKHASFNFILILIFVSIVGLKMWVLSL